MQNRVGNSPSLAMLLEAARVRGIPPEDIIDILLPRAIAYQQACMDNLSNELGRIVEKDLPGVLVNDYAVAYARSQRILSILRDASNELSDVDREISAP